MKNTIDLQTEKNETVKAKTPVIVSASRSTDIPAFYTDWFMERLRRGYVRWVNPFNQVSQYVSFAETRVIVFWSKKDKSQRKECGCIMNKDIGRYDTCHHLCTYCYANTSCKAVENNIRKHNPESDALVT
jgi:hypothetical protein